MNTETLGTTTELLGQGLRLGDPVSVGNLTLFPVFHNWPSANYVLYEDAARRGLVEVTELDEGASVPQLKVINTGDAPVLFVEGEILVGMQQTRTLNISVLAPAKETTLIPVSCVERGRWYSTTRVASKDDFHLAPDLRASKTASVLSGVSAYRRGYEADQGKVWTDVKVRFERQMSWSETDSYADLNRQRAAEVDATIAGLTPEPEQVGLVAALEGRVVALDVFDSPGALAATWRGLVGSYVTDALLAGSGSSGVADAQEWLADLFGGAKIEHEGVGVGSVVQLTGPSSIGFALVADDTIVHLAAFPTSNQHDRVFAI
jgi:hypothetical protein